MTEELTVDVPVVQVGESYAAEKLGGMVMHLREHVSARALPGDLPASLELDITPLRDFDAVLHVRDLVVPDGVTVLTDLDEPLARVQPPRVEEEPTGVAATLAPEATADAGESTGAAAEAE
jgi:large subunit ribosomal protein L25